MTGSGACRDVCDELRIFCWSSDLYEGADACAASQYPRQCFDFCWVHPPALKHVLATYGGTLPANVLTCFTNTGKEMPQTLDFVRECGQRWDVPIVWLEYDPAGETRRKLRTSDVAL